MAQQLSSSELSTASSSQTCPSSDKWQSDGISLEFTVGSCFKLPEELQADGPGLEAKGGPPVLPDKPQAGGGAHVPPLL